MYTRAQACIVNAITNYFPTHSQVLPHRHSERSEESGIDTAQSSLIVYYFKLFPQSAERRYIIIRSTNVYHQCFALYIINHRLPPPLLLVGDGFPCLHSPHERASTPTNAPQHPRTSLPTTNTSLAPHARSSRYSRTRPLHSKHATKKIRNTAVADFITNLVVYLQFN